MIRANHKNFIVKFSNEYSKLLLKFFFRGIRYIGEYTDHNLPVLMISNHFSWWDGFIQIQLNNKYFKKRFYFMMLENELRKSMILTKLGAFSIEKGKRSSRESLVYSTEILQDPDNLLLFFPQGKIQSLYTRPFVLEKGMLTYILENMKIDFQMVFNVNLIDYSSKRRPAISVYFRTYTTEKNTSSDQVERDFNLYANECMNKQQEE